MLPLGGGGNLLGKQSYLPKNFQPEYKINLGFKVVVEQR